MSDIEPSELPDFDIEFEDARPRSPACLILVALATPILLACSLVFLALLVIYVLQMINARP